TKDKSNVEQPRAVSEDESKSKPESTAQIVGRFTAESLIMASRDRRVAEAEPTHRAAVKTVAIWHFPNCLDDFTANYREVSLPALKFLSRKEVEQLVKC